MVVPTAFNGTRLIAGTGASAFAAKVSAHLDAPSVQTEIGCFPDGEVKVHFVDDVRGSDAFILQCFDEQRVHDQLMELFALIDCARRASVGRITAVIPYHPSGRQDQKDKPRVPITTKLVANIIAASGADRVLTMDPHTAQIQEFNADEQETKKHFIAFNGMRLIAGTGASAFATKVALHLDAPLAPTEIGCSSDGEVKLYSEDDIRGSDVFILQCFGERKINEWLMELFALIDCARRASAGRITAVIPYHPYARQDRKDKPRVPITAKLVANIISELGADRVLTMDLHAAQIQGFYDIPVDHLYGRPVLIRQLRRCLDEANVDPSRLVIVASDFGSDKMARAYARALGVPLATINKRRVSETETVIDGLVGTVRNCVAVLVDDIIATAGTMKGDIVRLIEEGATAVYLSATHGMLCGPAKQRLIEAPVRQVFISDSVPQVDLPSKITPVSMALLVGEAMRRIHRSQSVSELFNDAFVDRFFTEHGQ